VPGLPRWGYGSGANSASPGPEPPPRLVTERHHLRDGADLVPSDPAGPPNVVTASQGRQKLPPTDNRSPPSLKEFKELD